MQVPNLCSRLRRPCASRPGSQAKLLVVVEGSHDVVFLRTLSRILHAADPAIPDLEPLEQAGELVLLPFGGGEVLAWAERLAAIGLPEVHIYDRESPPETELRRQAAALVNRRRHCRAYLTSKRSLENYIHPSCIREISGLELVYGDDDDVADLVARACHKRLNKSPAWNALPARARKRFCERAKKWLNRLAVQRMTPDLLAEQDACGEIREWLAAIAELMQRTC